MRNWFLAGVALLLPSAASAQNAQSAPDAPSAQGEVSLTIYNNDQALVQDIRRIALPAGAARQEFPDVSAKIRPETVTLDTNGASIVEQNFDYDLLTPQTLLEKSLGQTITVVRTNPGNGQETSEEAQVLAVNDGAVLRVGTRIETLSNGTPERVVFPKVPDNLRARPTLSVTLDSEHAGARPVTLSYLTPGLGWKADYVALWDQTSGKVDMQGWVTLTNETGTTFHNARLLLVAGQAGASPQPLSRWQPPQPNSLRKAGTETAPRERLGDFYLYPMAARTTVADQQTKQVSFLDVAGVPAQAKYEFYMPWLTSEDEPKSAHSVLRFNTGRKAGLGDAMPAGTVRVYMRDARGQPQFLGENQVEHTPMGSDVGITTGDAFDVKVQPVVEQRTRLAPAKWRTQMRYTLTNAKPTPVTVDLAQEGLDWTFEDTRIETESLPSERTSSNAALWHVPVPANGQAVVTATFDTRF